MVGAKMGRIERQESRQLKIAVVQVFNRHGQIRPHILAAEGFLMSTACQLTIRTTQPKFTRRHATAIAAATPMVMAPALCGPQGWTTITGLVLAQLLITASVTDLANRKIYNWSTYTAFAWAILINTPISRFAFPTAFPTVPSITSLAHTYGQLAPIGLQNSITGAVVCFAVMLVAYAVAHGGAGDVKLATVIGALVGVDDGILIIAFSYVLAAIAILSWTVWTLGPMVLVNALFRKLGSYILPELISPPSQRQQVLLEKPVPLAGFFALGTLVVLCDMPSLVRTW